MCPVIAYFIYKRWSKVEITITDKRVYGVNSAGKRVDLPMDSISAVGTGIFSSLAITTASGAIKFAMLANRDELHKALSNLLVERQGKPVTTISGSASPRNSSLSLFTPERALLCDRAAFNKLLSLNS